MHEDLIKRLREKAARFDYDGWVDTVAILKEAADAIEDLSREIDIDNAAMTAMDAATPRWIPVTERLPEERISELTDDFSYYPCIYQAYDGKREVRYYQYGKGRFNKGHFWHGAQIMDDSIIAWAEPMPLPEPPEEDKP